MAHDIPRTLDEQQARKALSSILTSDSFADANRLKSFLTYVVEETLAGRGDSIRAKRIAKDVYGRRPEMGSEQEAIVRVDAGRLRRRLDAYYANEGQQDPVRVRVLPGGYVPTFDLLEAVSPEADENPIRPGGFFTVPIRFLAAALIAGCLGFGLGWYVRAVLFNSSTAITQEAPAAAKNSQGQIRLSVNQVSSASLLARTFVEDANELIFPSIDLARLNAAELLCSRATELGPDLSVGYACKAFAQAFSAFIANSNDNNDSRLSSARKAADAALRIEPDNAYAQMASAWTMFAEGNRKAALERAHLALDIEPENDTNRNFLAMMMAFDGQSAQLLSNDEQNENLSGDTDLYHPFIIAGTKYLTQRYDETVAAIEFAIKSEGRTSALMTVLYVAALEETGEHARAENFAENFVSSWKSPNFRSVLSSYFTHEADVQAIMTPLDAVLLRLETD